MSQEAIAIIEEFLSSDKANVRANAVVALNVVETPECKKRVLEMAAHDAEAKVRETAEDEFLSLDEVPKGVLDEVVESMGRTRDNAIYAMLGRLRHKGLGEWVKLHGLRRRLALALGLFSHYDRSGKWFRFKRSIKPGLKGSIAGVIVCNVAFGWQALDDVRPGELTFILLLLFLSSALSAIVGGLRSSPISLYYDKVAGIFVETLWAGLMGLLVGLLTQLLWVIAFYGEFDFLMVLMLAASFIAVRIGSIVTVGAETRIQRKSLQIAVASACGLLTLTVFSLLLINFDLNARIFYYADDAAWYNNVIWYFSLPSMVSLAFMYVSVDGEPGQAATPMLGQATMGKAMLPVYLLVALYFVAVIAPGQSRNLWEMVDTSEARPINTLAEVANRGGGYQMKVPVTTLPYRLDVTMLTQPVAFQVDVTDAREWNTDLAYFLFDENGNPMGRSTLVNGYRYDPAIRHEESLTPKPAKGQPGAKGGRDAQETEGNQERTYSVIVIEDWVSEQLLEEKHFVSLENLLSSLQDRFLMTLHMKTEETLKVDPVAVDPNNIAGGDSANYPIEIAIALNPVTDRLIR